MLDLGTLFVNIMARTTGLERGANKTIGRLDSIGKTATKVSQGMKTAGRTMNKAVTLPALAIGGVSLKAFASFDDKMNQSVAIMGDVSDTMKNKMSKAARQMALETTFSASQAAESYFFLASAGLDAEQSLKALPVVAKFGQAGMFDMATATDLVTDAQSAMGLTVKDATQNVENMARVSDVLVGANTLANASVEQFSKAMIIAAPSAKNLGIDLEATTSILAALADRGIKAERAGTALAFTLPQLSDAAERNSEAWEEFGLKIFDAEGAMRPFPDFVDNVKASLEGMTAEQKASTLSALGLEGRMGRVINTLMDAGDQMRDYEGKLRSAGGITELIAAKQLKSFSAQMKILKNRIMDVAIDIGAHLAPSVRKLGEFIASVAERFKALDPSMQRVVVTGVAIAAAIGPILLVVGSLVGMIPFIISGFTFLAGVSFAPIIATLAAVAVAFFAVKWAVGRVIESFGLFGDEGDKQATNWTDRIKNFTELFITAFTEIEFIFKRLALFGELSFENMFIAGINALNDFKANFDVNMDGLFAKFGAVEKFMSGDFNFTQLVGALDDISLDVAAGQVEPDKVAFRDLATEIAALDAQKFETLADRLAGPIQELGDGLGPAQAAQEVADAAEKAGGVDGPKTVDKMATAVEAGSVEAFRLENRQPMGSVDGQQLNVQKAILKETKSSKQAMRQYNQFILDEMKQLNQGGAIT